jgi:putative transposase
LALFQNSITKYRNTKYKKEGHLFSGRFKAVRIEDESQLLHVHRYIHLNPYTSYVVKNIADLENYPYSSFREYLGLDEGFCNKNVILSSFSNIDEYKKFVFNQADYQRELKKITHLVFD